MYLDSFAELFAGAGLNALAFDNRNFGASDGEPRQEIDLWAQVDAGRIGIWGSSHSGGHVLVVAAIERRVKAVLSQVPLVSGHANLRALVRAAFIAGFREQFDADRQVDADEFAAQVSGVAALAEPVRRDLYFHVAAQPGPVSRDQASEGVGAAHTAKFHLDKLVEEGLLDPDFKRMSGRQGRGAGRPAKLYRRSGRQVSVTLPERRYDLAGELMARAIEDSAQTGVAVVDALHGAATDLGATLGERLRPDVAVAPGRERLIAAACGTLSAHGYEPRRQGDTITMANCPFDALAREHTALVCGMNLALLGALADQVGDGLLGARLDPAADRCCVVLSAG